MILRMIPCLLIAALVASCSERERTPGEEAEWAEIEAMADDARPVLTTTNEVPDAGFGEEVPAGEFDYFIRKLAAMKSVKRGEGQTLLTGESLVLDHDQGFVQMNHDVVIEDDQGVMKTESLIGRFSMGEELEVERVEASGGVEVVSAGRTVHAEQAFYNHPERLLVLSGAASAAESTNSIAADRLRIWLTVENQLEKATAEGGVRLRHGEILATGDSGLYDATREYARLEGQAMVESGENRVTAERLEIWTTEGARRVVCEPNVVLVGSTAAFELDGVPATTNGLTEIRGNRLVYSEKAGTVDLVGSVRVRDPRAAMNCDQIRLNLKDGSEIDWIEAVGGVIIQIGEIEGLPPNVDVVKALAGRATYRVAENKFTLEQEPKVKVGLNVMTGKQVSFWVNPWSMVCEPNARVLLHLDEETKAKFLKDLNE